MTNLLGATAFAQADFNGLARQDNGSWHAVAARVVKAFRALNADPERPHASKMNFFWRYISEKDMRRLFDRLADVLMPRLSNPFDRNGITALLLQQSHDMSTKLRMFRVEWHAPLGVAMERRGRETQQMCKSLIDVLSARSVSCAPQKPKKTSCGPGLFVHADPAQGYVCFLNILGCF